MATAARGAKEGAVKLTRYVIVGVVLMIGVYDMSVIALIGAHASISRTFLGDMTAAPTIPFALGFVMGHLSWPQRMK